MSTPSRGPCPAPRAGTTRTRARATGGRAPRTARRPRGGRRPSRMSAAGDQARSGAPTSTTSETAGAFARAALPALDASPFGAVLPRRRPEAFLDRPVFGSWRHDLSQGYQLPHMCLASVPRACRSPSPIPVSLPSPPPYANPSGRHKCSTKGVLPSSRTGPSIRHCYVLSESGSAEPQPYGTSVTG